MAKPLAVVILAAGKGTRMNNPDLPKVMHEVQGKPMIQHVVELANTLAPSHIVVVVGWQKQSVINHFEKLPFPVMCVEQSPQLGTGHAVMQSESTLAGFQGDVLVLSGDVPLLTASTVTSLIQHHRSARAVATVLTANLDDPTGYGRILRGGDGNVYSIVEQRDATEDERKVREVNSGIYLFDAPHLFDGLKHITTSNAQAEYYLTDVFSYFWKSKFRVAALAAPDFREIMGINTMEQLEEARSMMRMSRG
ncbi:MAG: NTP transferase domain-containing protein [Bacteroidota bacterium]